MGCSAKSARAAEALALSAIKRVHNSRDQLVNMSEEGFILSKEGIDKYLDEVTMALAQMKDAKASYQAYGSSCLHILGLGNKLSLNKIKKVALEQQQQHQEATKKDFHCNFCERKFPDFALASNHILHMHHEDIAMKVRWCLFLRFFLLCFLINRI